MPFLFSYCFSYDLKNKHVYIGTKFALFADADEYIHPVKHIKNTIEELAIGGPYQAFSLAAYAAKHYDESKFVKTKEQSNKDENFQFDLDDYVTMDTKPVCLSSSYDPYFCPSWRGHRKLIANLSETCRLHVHDVAKNVPCHSHLPAKFLSAKE
eukprot:Awhi_evm1s14299